MKTKSMILKIFYHEIEIEVNSIYSDTYKKIDSELCSNIDKLQDELTPYPNLLELFNKIIDLFFDAECESAESHYKKGFKDGALMALDIVGFEFPQNTSL